MIYFYILSNKSPTLVAFFLCKNLCMSRLTKSSYWMWWELSCHHDFWLHQSGVGCPHIIINALLICLFDVKYLVYIYIYKIHNMLSTQRMVRLLLWYVVKPLLQCCTKVHHSLVTKSLVVKVFHVIDWIF